MSRKKLSRCRLPMPVNIRMCRANRSSSNRSPCSNEKEFIVVRLETNHDTIDLELDATAAPKTVENFLQYVRDGHYDNSVFHRVIDVFMVQGGGFSPCMYQKPARPPVANEADNGLRNDRYTVAMARTG